VTMPRPAGVTDVRAGLCPGGRAVLEVFWGERDVFAWWVNEEGLVGRRLGSATELQAMVDLARGLLADEGSGSAWRAPVERLAELLLPPLHGAAEVIVVPDGALATFPFETLLDAEGRPLAVTTSVAYGPSASVLLALAARPAHGRAERALLAVGAPTLVGTSAGVAGQAGVGLDPLPYARQEVRSLARLFPPSQVEVLVGEQATLDGWIARHPARYRFLHFATHAWVSERHPQETSILLADRPLTLPFIRKLDLDADLVTLSACDTALGQAVPGEGLVGLSHAFLAAGVGGTVVSLWRVEDQAAESFMVRLYQALADGDPPAEALHRARLESGVASGAHPALWSPFVVVGGLS
jgi:CHAT domain-containing protein